MVIACRRRRRVPNARWPTWWTWSAGSPAGRWTRWRWNCPARPASRWYPMPSCSARRCAFTPRSSRWCFPASTSRRRYPRPTRRWPSCTIASPANTWRVSAPAASPIWPGRPCAGCCRRENPSANEWPRRCTCRSAPCNDASRRRAPATSNCSTTHVGLVARPGGTLQGCPAGCAEAWRRVQSRTWADSVSPALPKALTTAATFLPSTGWLTSKRRLATTRLSSVRTRRAS